ncbi:UbiA family prenyltransferase [Pedobacter cryoconitis]|uniref:4-hydroxybenzoate polyprenyltransferase n=1 Tax=Pedobacter cryoconitis TaxID=188932 RepID=A0A7X0IZU2_9SPHI|nr:UbiA family prenyltransferase [Pedobacter cryoconitis]MBB6498114.1 4-hydroxybenzoate polyprenyltransferase [Pedobacter cryoconitis]
MSFKFTRATEWWEYKLVPLLSIGYATLLLQHESLYQTILKLLWLLAAIIIGAVYVSVINDLTDITEDAAAGKLNRMAKIAPVWRIILVSSCLLIGVAFGWMIYPDYLSLFCYLMAWIVFSLYSIPPVRLKKRGIWGLLCDAMGAHLFPTLFIVSSLSGPSGINMPWFIAGGLWSLFYGLRGILWHQFDDRSNDLLSGTTTFASKIEPENFITAEILIFGLEAVSFSVLLFLIWNSWIFLSLVLYFLVIWIRKAMLDYQLCLIITPESRPHQLLTNDYYLVFFPLALLFTAVCTTPYSWIILCCHLVLFPGKTILVLKDVYISLKKLIKT